MQNQQDINKLISDLPFTEQFKSAADQMNFKTIADILEYDSGALIKMPGFNYHFLQEFINYIENNGLADLLKE